MFEIKLTGDVAGFAMRPNQRVPLRFLGYEFDCVVTEMRWDSSRERFSPIRSMGAQEQRRLPSMGEVCFYAVPTRPVRAGVPEEPVAALPTLASNEDWRPQLRANALELTRLDAALRQECARTKAQAEALRAANAEVERLRAELAKYAPPIPANATRFTLLEVD